MNARLIRSLAASLLASGLIAAAADPASAATNNPGAVQAPAAYCGTNEILLSMPVMTPAPNQYVPPGTVLIGAENTEQKVAFRADLAEWDGSQWVIIREGTWFTTVVGQHGEIDGKPWTTLDGEPVVSMIGAVDLPQGTWEDPIYYAFWIHYYWFPDDFRGEGFASGWAFAHYENRGAPEGSAFYDTKPYEWCKYPGPNSIVGID